MNADAEIHGCPSCFVEGISELSGMNKTLQLLLEGVENINEEGAERIQELEGYGMLSSRHDTDIAKSQTQSSGSSLCRTVHHQSVMDGGRPCGILFFLLNH